MMKQSLPDSFIWAILFTDARVVDVLTTVVSVETFQIVKKGVKQSSVSHPMVKTS